MLRRRLVTTLLAAGVVAVPAAPASAGTEVFTGARQIDGGGNTTCATMPSGTARCWGQHDQGQRGTGLPLSPGGQPGTVERIDDGEPLPNIAQVTVGNAHACARTTGGRAFCWGDNSHSQTGNSQFDPPDYTSAVPVRLASSQQPLTGVRQLSAGYDHTCALVAGGEVRCWGRNDSRQVGVSQVGDWGAAVPVIGPSGSGRLRNVIQIASGGFHTCALLSDHSVRCWGANSIGELGGGFVGEARARPVRVVAPGGTGPLLDVRSVAGGVSHTCALLGSGQVRCWGYDASHQLGTLGAATNRSRPVVVRNTAGAALTGVVQIAAGNEVSCARLSNGRVTCWGEDGRGQRGDGANAATNGARLVLRAAGSPADPGGPGPLTGALQVTGGGEHVCARVRVGDDTRVQCWGDNLHVQTGNSAATPTYDRPVSVFAQPDQSE
jgi:alpha-tubulin suppressor-like RCC1 family protein